MVCLHCFAAVDREFFCSPIYSSLVHSEFMRQTHNYAWRLIQMLFDYIPRLYANYLAGCSLWGWRTLPRPPWQWNSWESGGTLLSSDSKRWNRWKWSKMQVVQVIGMSGATAHHLVWQFWKSREHSLLWKQWKRISVNGNVIPLAVKICCSCSYCNIKFPFVLRIWKLEPPTLSFFLF